MQKTANSPSSSTANRAKKGTDIDLRKTALLVIDMQKDLVKTEGGYFAPLFQAIQSNKVIENIARVIKGARETKVPIWHIATVHRKDGADVVPTITDFMLQGLVPKEMGEVMVEGTPGADFIDELKPAAEDYVVVKRRSSAFHNTDLDLLLRTRGIDTLILAGVVTNGCVENTARDARQRDYHVLVLSDCCASIMPEAHDYAMNRVFPGMGRVRTSGEMLAVMKK